MKELMFLILILLLVSSLAFSCVFDRPRSDDPLLKKIRHDILRLEPRLSFVKFFSSDESCTKFKEKVYLCLRDEHGQYYDYNMLMYVAIHECAHVLSPSYDDKHETKEFRYLFSQLLDRAEKLGIYNSQKPLPSMYCHIKMD